MFFRAASFARQKLAPIFTRAGGDSRSGAEKIPKLMLIASATIPGALTYFAVKEGAAWIPGEQAPEIVNPVAEIVNPVAEAPASSSSEDEEELVIGIHKCDMGVVYDDEDEAWLQIDCHSRFYIIPENLKQLERERRVVELEPEIAERCQEV